MTSTVADVGFSATPAAAWRSKPRVTPMDPESPRERSMESMKGPSVRPSSVVKRSSIHTLAAWALRGGFGTLTLVVYRYNCPDAPAEVRTNEIVASTARRALARVVPLPLRAGGISGARACSHCPTASAGRAPVTSQ